MSVDSIRPAKQRRNEMEKIGSGRGKRNARIEIAERKRILENYAERVEETGRYPGTHSLGAQFKTR